MDLSLDNENVGVWASSSMALVRLSVGPLTMTVRDGLAEIDVPEAVRSWIGEDGYSSPEARAVTASKLIFGYYHPHLKQQFLDGLSRCRDWGDLNGLISTALKLGSSAQFVPSAVSRPASKGFFQKLYTAISSNELTWHNAEGGLGDILVLSSDHSPLKLDLAVTFPQLQKAQYQSLHLIAETRQTLTDIVRRGHTEIVFPGGILSRAHSDLQLLCEEHGIATTHIEVSPWRNLYRCHSGAYRDLRPSYRRISGRQFASADLISQLRAAVDAGAARRIGPIGKRASLSKERPMLLIMEMGNRFRSQYSSHHRYEKWLKYPGIVETLSAGANRNGWDVAYVEHPLASTNRNVELPAFVQRVPKHTNLGDLLRVCDAMATFDGEVSANALLYDIPVIAFSHVPSAGWPNVWICETTDDALDALKQQQRQKGTRPCIDAAELSASLEDYYSWANVTEASVGYEDDYRSLRLERLV